MSMKMVISSSIISALSAFLLGSVAQATQPVTMAISTVGNPGNAADTTGYGNVGYTFGIGTYDVTQGQYTAFLNAVAQTDIYSLYNAGMATVGNDSYVNNGFGITQSGVLGSYSYTVNPSYANLPVTFVSWFDAARFSNWLNNGQPVTHVEDASTTETGAYTLNGATSGIVTKNLLAQWYIPSEDEWYKAAYYDPSLDNGLGGYSAYATRGNAAQVPGNHPGSLSNQANYLTSFYSVTQSSSYSSSQNYLTPVGSFRNSASAYGTYDQAGDVNNWNDAVFSSSFRGYRGGEWASGSYAMASSYRRFNSPTLESAYIGFRVANAPAPEPTSIMLIGLGSVVLASLRRKTLKT